MSNAKGTKLVQIFLLSFTEFGRHRYRYRYQHHLPIPVTVPLNCIGTDRPIPIQADPNWRLYLPKQNPGVPTLAYSAGRSQRSVKHRKKLCIISCYNQP